MSDPDYLHACQRAELLGQPAPTEEEWAETLKAECNAQDDNEMVEEAVVQDLEQRDETMKRVGGGLDELNTILSATQKKISRFKTVCGSLSTLLRVRVGSRTNTPDHKPLAPNSDTENSSAQEFISNDDESLTIETSDGQGAQETEEVRSNPKRIDLNEKMGSHLDKLDSLINKAENAQYSMQHQTKQMKKILK